MLALLLRPAANLHRLQSHDKIQDALRPTKYGFVHKRQLARRLFRKQAVFPAPFSRPFVNDTISLLSRDPISEHGGDARGSHGTDPGGTFPD